MAEAKNEVGTATTKAELFVHGVYHFLSYLGEWMESHGLSTAMVIFRAYADMCLKLQQVKIIMIRKVIWYIQ